MGTASRRRGERAAATTPATTEKHAPIAQIQRAPSTFVTGPATAIAGPRIAYVTLIASVKARPRYESGTPRWISSTLYRAAAPLPMPATTTGSVATQTFGATEASK